MKKIALFALAASTAAIATPASAQAISTGTINITGSVASKCSVVNGSSTSATWGTTIDMGELSQADGTLLASATLASTFNTQTGTNRIARVVCSTLNPKISVDADPLVNATAAVTGYVNTVHFQADVLVAKATTTASTYSNDSLAAPGSATAIGDALAATGDNITITTSNWRTISNSGQQMVAGTYNNGKIVVTVSPI